MSQSVGEETFESQVARLDQLAAQLKLADQNLSDESLDQQTDPEQLARRCARLEEQESLLEKARVLLEARRELTRSQRQRIAHGLKNQRTQLNEERETFVTESKRIQQQLKREKTRLAKQQDELEAAQSKELPGREQFSEREHAELAELRGERAQLIARIEELEQQIAEAPQATAAQMSAEDVAHMDDLQRRFEMAIDDVRQLKRRNAELEEGLAEIQVGDESCTAADSEDWNATKRRLVAALKLDGEGEAGLTADDRLTVEGAICITDDIVARRDQEIAALKEQLKEQLAERPEQPASSPPVDSAAAEQLLDKDETIRLERERLAALKLEWKEKLRQAEVELSVQRAEIARHRAELQEKMRNVETEKDVLASQRASVPGSPQDKSKKPARKWLERMGLKELDAE